MKEKRAMLKPTILWNVMLKKTLVLVAFDK